MLFQMTFAIITPALIIGAFTERVRVRLRDPVLGALADAGLCAGSALGLGRRLARRGGHDRFRRRHRRPHDGRRLARSSPPSLIGPRDGFPLRLEPPHSPGMTMAGAGMLWVGWFGFNGGSALAADASAASAILATHLAAAAAGLAWMTVERMRFGKPTSVGIVTGCGAGLATITPASGYVGPIGATAMGAVSGVLCFFATVFRQEPAQDRRFTRCLRGARDWRDSRVAAGRRVRVAGARRQRFRP